MPPITHDQVRSLAEVSTSTAMVSCYLDVDGRHHARRQDLAREIDVLIRQARQRLNGNHDVGQDLQRIAEFVKAGVDRSTVRGLAIFSCRAQDFWEVVRLPVRVPSQIVIGYSPAVGPLEAAISAHTRTAALLVDKARVRVLVHEWGEINEVAELVDDLMRGYDDRGEKERGDVAPHQEEHAAQHFRTAARIAFDAQARTGFDRLVIGGAEAAVAEVERQLHPYLRRRYCGRVDLGATAGAEDVRRAIVALDAEITRKEEAEAVARLRAAAHGGDRQRAVLGLRPTLEAIAGHRAERVLVSYGYQEPGWRCQGCGRLAALGPICPGCGATMAEVEDVVSELIDRVLAERGRVDVCVDCADLDVVGRIGAFLRF